MALMWPLVYHLQMKYTFTLIQLLVTLLALVEASSSSKSGHRSRSRSHHRRRSTSSSASETLSSGSLFEFRSRTLSNFRHRAYHHRDSSHHTSDDIRAFEELGDEYETVLMKIESVRADMADIEADLVNVMLDNLGWNCDDEPEQECDLRDLLSTKKDIYTLLEKKKSSLRALMRDRLRHNFDNFTTYYKDLEDDLRYKLSYRLQEGKYSEAQDLRESIDRVIYHRTLIRCITRRRS